MNNIPTFNPNHWRTTHSTIIINTPRQHIWDILTDFDAYNQWNPFTYDVEIPQFKVGESFQFTVKLGKSERLQKELITQIEEPTVMAWRYPFQENIWLSPIRYQVLTELSESQTQYQTWEHFSGLVAPILKLLVLSDVQAGFDMAAQALKQRCESTYTTK
ncbi:MAG: hypothetical protein Phog2KO_36370 [Phototrophicaceae bacterium]